MLHLKLFLSNKDMNYRFNDGQLLLFCRRI